MCVCLCVKKVSDKGRIFKERGKKENLVGTTEPAMPVGKKKM